MQPQTVTVGLDDRSYHIRIGSHLIDCIGKEISPILARPRLAIIADKGASSSHLDRLLKSLESSDIENSYFILPSGESTKSWQCLQATVEWLIEQKIERQDVVMAFGGGVVGDLTGFAAAILRRGVNYIQVPSTLLAQVDSSIGGKTGINSRFGKNLIGAFHQPKLVICDVELLTTLSPRDFLAGCGEIIKYGLIADCHFFSWLEENALNFNPKNPKIISYAVRRSCEIKTELVEQDEQEEGRRTLLNLGHTFAHALEAATGYSGQLLHGEAVAIGCCLALELSSSIGLCDASEAERANALFKKFGMKTTLRDVKDFYPSVDNLINHMQQDKKVVAEKLRFVLANRIGDVFVTSKVQISDVKRVLINALEA